MDLIKEIHHYLADEITRINESIINSLAVEEGLIQVISNHLSNAGGKRIRPILTVLSTKIFGCEDDNSIKLAAAIEFIHMATLLHDDVVDGSKMRRFLPTANTVWGSKASILVGDFLFSRSFQLIVSTRLHPALKVLSDASAIIAEGEVTQLAKLEQKRLISREEYLKIINAKTAELFAAACEVGAIVAGRDRYSGLLRNYGLYLGNIFQIADDLLDYFSTDTKVGKNIGDDFYEGKVTLPLILTADKISSQDREKLEEMIKAPERKEDDFSWVKSKMIECGISQDILKYLNEIKLEAFAIFDKIDNVENYTAKNYLKKLIEFAVERTY